MGLLSLVAKLGINTTGYSAGLTRARQMTDAWGRSVKSNIKGHLAAAVGGAAIAATIGKAIEKAGKVEDLADSFGVSTDAVQELDYALRQSGGNIDELERSFKQLAKARQMALQQPTGQQAQSFNRLGVSTEDLNSGRVEEIYRKIGAAIQSAKDPQAVLADGMQILGTEADATLRAMAIGLAGLSEEANRFGQVMSEQTVSDVALLGDAMDQLKGKFISTFATGMAKVLEWNRLAKRTIISTMTDLGFFMEGKIAEIGAFWGAAAGGASKEEAAKEMQATFDAIAAEGKAERERLHAQYVQEDQDRVQRIEVKQRQRRAVAEARMNLENIGSDARGAKTTREKELERGALAKVGGFTGFAARVQDPLVGLSQKQLAEQVQIRRNTTPRTRDTANFNQ